MSTYVARVNCTLAIALGVYAAVSGSAWLALLFGAVIGGYIQEYVDKGTITW